MLLEGITINIPIIHYKKVISEGVQLCQRFFLVDEGRDDHNTTKSGPSSARQQNAI